jgi:hypothetical protein
MRFAARLLAVVGVVLIAVGLSACFPSFITSRPRAAITVTDERGVPLEGATVTLGTTEWHGPGGVKSTQIFTTDSAGSVRFGAERVWKLQIDVYFEAGIRGGAHGTDRFRGADRSRAVSERGKFRLRVAAGRVRAARARA